VSATKGHVQEVAAWRVLTAVIGSVDQGLEATDVVRVCKVDDIDGHVVLLESHSEILKVVLSSRLEWMTDEDDDPLSLRLVLSVLKSQLGYLDGLEDVGVSVDLDVVDAVDQVTNFVCLGHAEFNPK